MSSKPTVFDIWQLGDEWPNLEELAPELPAGDQSENEILKIALGDSARSVVVEHEYIDKDYRNVYSGFYSKKFSRSSSRAARLHFFDVPLRKKDLEGGKDLSMVLRQRVESLRVPDRPGTSPGYLGSVVLRPTEYSRLGRTLLDPRKLKTPFVDSAQFCLAPFSNYLLGHRLEVMAFPHQSQDAQVHTCAETALWSQMRYLSQRYRHYGEVYPHDIARHNTVLAGGRPIPSRGLSLLHIASILGKFGLDAEMYSREDLSTERPTDEGFHLRCPPIEQQEALLRLLYMYLDSGMPPILGLPMHAAVAVGIEQGERPLSPCGNRLVIPASDLMTAIAVNDDHFAPYRRLARVVEAPLSYGLDEVDSLAVPLPAKVFLAADHAEAVIADLFEGILSVEALNEWMSMNDLQLPLIRRVVCTSSKNYKQFRQKTSGPVENLLLLQPLPHFIWIGEFYPLDLWPERQAVIEIVLDATGGHRDRLPYLWIRLPGRMYVNWERLYGSSERPQEIPLPAEDPKIFEGFEGNLFGIHP